jgi:hypothetical protein
MADPTRSARKGNTARSCILAMEPQDLPSTRTKRKRFDAFIRLLNIQTEIDAQMTRQAELIEEMDRATKKMILLIEEVKTILTPSAPDQTQDPASTNV